MAASNKFKALDKLFGYNNRLKRYNEKYGTEYKESEFMVLFTISKYESVFGGVRFEIILEALKGVNRTKHGRELRNILTSLIEQGFASVSKDWPKRYSVSINGLNLLADLDAVVGNKRLKMKKL